LQTAMIKRAEVEKVELQKGDRYRVNVQLKDRYREKYAQATEKSIGQIFALTYHGDILTSPMVNTKITSGRTTIGIFKTRQRAEEIKRRILGKQEYELAITDLTTEGDDGVIWWPKIEMLIQH